MRTRIFSDPDAQAEAAAAEIATWLSMDASHTIGLAGGTTPRRTYEALRQMTVPWHEVHAWMTDERHVPPGHPDWNAGMARRSLFDHIPATLHEVPYDEDPTAAAQAYEDTLRSVLNDEYGRMQAGLVVLGVGTDGHTASLFPGSPALEEDERRFVANWVESEDAWRLTATLPLLAQARRTLFIVSGESKAQIVAEILEQGTDHPAAVVNRSARDPVWLLDRAAASQLGQS